MNDLLVNPVFVGLVTGIIGVIGGYLGQRRTSVASIQDSWTKATAALIDQYTQALNASRLETAEMKREIADLGAKVEAQTDEIEALNNHIDVLTETLEKHGIAPPPRRRRSAVAANVAQGLEVQA